MSIIIAKIHRNALNSHELSLGVIHTLKTVDLLNWVNLLKGSDSAA